MHSSKSLKRPSLWSFLNSGHLGDLEWLGCVVVHVWLVFLALRYLKTRWGYIYRPQTPIESLEFHSQNLLWKRCTVPQIVLVWCTPDLCHPCLVKSHCGKIISLLVLIGPCHVNVALSNRWFVPSDRWVYCSSRAHWTLVRCTIWLLVQKWAL
jgi:hypothetical protein